jgi:hypothetical protein
MPDELVTVTGLNFSHQKSYKGSDIVSKKKKVTTMCGEESAHKSYCNLTKTGHNNVGYGGTPTPFVMHCLEETEVAAGSDEE